MIRENTMETEVYKVDSWMFDDHTFLGIYSNFEAATRCEKAQKKEKYKVTIVTTCLLLDSYTGTTGEL